MKRSIRKSISKKKNRLISANEQNRDKPNRPPASTITTSNISKTNLSDITHSSVSANQPAVVSNASSSARKMKKDTVASAWKSIKPRQKAFSKVVISKTSRRTPNQVKAADIERNSSITLLQKAYKWAVSEAGQYKNKVKLAKVASSKFNVTVIPQTL